MNTERLIQIKEEVVSMLPHLSNEYTAVELTDLVYEMYEGGINVEETMDNKEQATNIIESINNILNT